MSIDEKIWQELFERARSWMQAKEALAAWDHDHRFATPDSEDWNSPAARRIRTKADHAEILLQEQIEAIEAIVSAERS